VYESDGGVPPGIKTYQPQPQRYLLINQRVHAAKARGTPRNIVAALFSVAHISSIKQLLLALAYIDAWLKNQENRAVPCGGVLGADSFAAPVGGYYHNGDSGGGACHVWTEIRQFRRAA